MRGCHCLCSHNHPDERDVCNGAHETEVQFNSPLTGPVDVPMCLACVGVTLARKSVAEASRRKLTEPARDA